MKRVLECDVSRRRYRQIAQQIMKERYGEMKSDKLKPVDSNVSLETPVVKFVTMKETMTNIAAERTSHPAELTQESYLRPTGPSVLRTESVGISDNEKWLKEWAVSNKIGRKPLQELLNWLNTKLTDIPTSASQILGPPSGLDHTKADDASMDSTFWLHQWTQSMEKTELANKSFPNMKAVDNDTTIGTGSGDRKSDLIEMSHGAKRGIKHKENMAIGTKRKAESHQVVNRIDTTNKKRR